MSQSPESSSSDTVYATGGLPAPSWMQLVAEFHRKFGHPISARPQMVSVEECALRQRLIDEEANELDDAWRVNQDIVAVADALGDLIYVVCGAALVFGIDLDSVVREIHRSNLTKLGADGKAIQREDGKIVKGPNYEEPQLASIIGVVTDGSEPY